MLSCRYTHIAKHTPTVKLTYHPWNSVWMHSYKRKALSSHIAPDQGQWKAAPGVGVCSHTSVNSTLSSYSDCAMSALELIAQLWSTLTGKTWAAPGNDPITRICDLIHWAASESLIRIRHGFNSMLEIIFIGWVRPGLSPPTTGLTAECQSESNRFSHIRSVTAVFFVTSVWFTPSVFGSILLQHESHFILRERPAWSGANSDSFMNI